MCEVTENVTRNDSKEDIHINTLQEAEIILSGFPLFYWQKSRISPGPPWEIFQDLFGAHECLNIKKKPFPLLLTRPPSPSFPLEVGPFKSS